MQGADFSARIVRNLFASVSHLPQEQVGTIHTLLSEVGSRRRCGPERTVATLIGISRWRVGRWYKIWQVKQAAFGAVDLVSGSPPADQDEDEDHGGMQTSAHALPLVDVTHQGSRSDPSASSDSDEPRQPPRISQCVLDTWRADPNYVVGMRLAELSTLWHVQGWSKEEFPHFLTWAKHHFPHAFGNINHSTRFLSEFLPSLVQATHTCLAAELHACVPALGIPSFLSRVIDVVSINGRSLLPTIYVYTNAVGELAWAHLGSPCLEHRDEAAFGAETFGFHRAPQLVRAVHTLEGSYHIRRADRAFRLITTIADQAIAGPGSTQFSRHERLVDNLEEDVFAEGVCKFHIADCVGCGSDKLFPETLLFDRTLRLVRRHFAWGTGDLILRAVAHKFASLASLYDQQSHRLQGQAADADVQGQPLAAQRLRQKSEKATQEARALHKQGWTRWQRPRAPKADGTRKVVWQSKTRESFFNGFAPVYWALLTRMQQTLERARLEAVKGGAVCPRSAGMKTAEMRAWKALGRAMTDIHVLVFNLGRMDFRKQNLSSYAFEVQASLRIHSAKEAFLYSDHMFTAVGVLVEMRGIVKMVHAMHSGLVLEQRHQGQVLTNKYRFTEPKKCMPMKTTMWMTCKTLLAHRCWRAFPGLSLKLTEILLGGTYKGVPLQSEMFTEVPLARGVTSVEQRAARASQRDMRFEATLKAIDRLMQWCQIERHEFLERILGLNRSKRIPVVQGAGLPEVGDLEFLRQIEACDSVRRSAKERKAKEVPEQIAEETSDAETRDKNSGCSFAPQRRPTVAGGEQKGGEFFDLFSDSFSADKKVVEDAAVGLAEACARLQGDLHQAPTIVTAAEIDATAGASVAQPLAGDIDSEDSENPLEDQTAGAVGPPQQPRESWVIYKWGRSVHFENLQTFREKSQQRQISKTDPRTALLTKFEELFGFGLVTGTHAESDIEAALSTVLDHCTGRFWGLPSENLASQLFHEHPKEMHEQLTLEDLTQQYRRLCAWLQSVESFPFAHEFFQVEALVVREQVTDRLVDVRVSEVDDASLWPPRWVPPVGASLTVKRVGKCRLESIRKKPDMTKFYSYCMSTSLHEIRCRRIWHITLAFHLFVQASTSSQSLSEGVGSFLQTLKRRNLNERLSTKSLVWATQLKSVGLRGLGGEEGVLAMALNTHFDCRGPEGWHFSAKHSKSKSVFDDWRHRARLARQPAWVGTHLYDLISSGRLRLTKLLPDPKLAFVKRCDRSTFTTLTHYHKRQRIAERADEVYDPKELPDSLWAKLGVNVAALPAYLRAGKQAR